MDESIDQRITKCLEEFFGSTEVDFWFDHDHALHLLSIGELIDRLTIVNIKLFKLKDYQATSTDGVGLARSAKADVALCKERSNIKSTLNEKVFSLATRVYHRACRSDADEVKLYGDQK